MKNCLSIFLLVLVLASSCAKKNIELPITPVI